MSEAAFIKAVGTRLAHVTAASNVALIRKQGLHPAAALARAAKVDPATLALRRTRMELSGGAVLNHQLPIVHGLRAAHREIEGYSPEEWAEQLDSRVFFWPARKGADFAKSIARDVPIATLWFDAGAFYRAHADRIDLAPGNSGNFLQGGSHMRRGDWFYVPATRMADFSRNRARQGINKGGDIVKEVSLRGSLSVAELNDLIVDGAP
ncbi:DUF7002 family protein [Pseudaestuariivita atlantica]|uniref:Uncharacterized protein n=1 Tax=Pseudaestuariivita atlantica TaxID=1317121 RepID=A0A0L1JKU7_9RHOB|nr:hypothetical protein [Pseudaestuariivita atlantica]KNG92376.1 hypothetical protein ATO11_17340 [Pseudaestuariivita atlantica]